MGACLGRRDARATTTGATAASAVCATAASAVCSTADSAVCSTADSAVCSTADSAVCSTADSAVCSTADSAVCSSCSCCWAVRQPTAPQQCARAGGTHVYRHSTARVRRREPRELHAASGPVVFRVARKQAAFHHGGLPQLWDGELRLCYQLHGLPDAADSDLLCLRQAEPRQR